MAATKFIALLILTVFRQSCSITLTALKRPLSVIPINSAISRDSRYGGWIIPGSVFYKLDATYTSGQQDLILQAMGQISADMNQCIGFQPYSPIVNNGIDYLYIGKTLNNGQSPGTCFSFPGRILDQAGRGQKVILVDGVNGCLTSVRDVMKFIVHSLGLRSEYNRPDRDAYIQVFTANVRPELQSYNIFKPFVTGQVDYVQGDFDYNSVTIPLPTKYSLPGSVAFTSKLPSRSFGTLARLSRGDCVGIALQNDGCNYASCQDPYSPISMASLFRPAMVNSTIPASTTSATTTPIIATVAPTKGAAEPVFPFLTGLSFN